MISERIQGYKYPTRDSLLDALNDERIVDKGDVAPQLLRAKVYAYGAGFPGCLYENGPHYAVVKADAVTALVDMIESELDADACDEDTRQHSDADGEEILRQARHALTRAGSYGFGNWIYSWSETTVADIL